jgi:hypothetical protein
MATVIRNSNPTHPITLILAGGTLCGQLTEAEAAQLLTDLETIVCENPATLGALTKSDVLRIVIDGLQDNGAIRRAVLQVISGELQMGGRIA